jgi:hypothetical protein
LVHGRENRLFLAVVFGGASGLLDTSSEMLINI